MNPVTEFTVNSINSTYLNDDSKICALERLNAIAKFELVKLRTEPPKSKYDFSTLPGIDDICIKTIIPYLSNDIQALVSLFGRTTKRFLNVLRVQIAYYKIVIPMKYGNNPGKELIHGCKYGTLTVKDAQCLVDILQRSLQVSENNDSKLNCLHYAAINGHLSIVQFLVEDFKMDIHVKDGTSKSVTYLSAFHGKVDVAAYLVTKGGALKDKNKGSLDAKYDQFTYGTPFVIACQLGHFDDVKSFIEIAHDANDMTLKEYVNHFGKDTAGSIGTPLMIAAQGEHFQIVKYLIEQGGADVNITNHNGWNALHYAARNCKSINVVELLLKKMSLDSINKKVPKGFTPLDFAYINRNIRVCVFSTILKAGGKQGFLLP